MRNFGRDWTLAQANDFVHACYDRDALLETLINFGASWLEGRLICLISNRNLQPVLARGWASWGDDESTTEAFLQLTHEIDPKGVLATVIQKTHHTFGSPLVLGIEELFEEAGVLNPDHLMVLPIKLGKKTKILFFGEPSFEVNDLQTFSQQAEPIVHLADEIGLQFEEIIRLAKAKQLPPKNERIPKVEDPKASPTEIFENTEPHDLEHYLPQSEPMDLEDEIELALDLELSNPLEIEEPEIENQHTFITAQHEPVIKDIVETPPKSTASTMVSQANTQEFVRGRSDTAQNEEHVGRPKPVSYDPDDQALLPDESGVNIMVPIGISDISISSKQTLLGGFSAKDLRKAMDAYVSEKKILKKPITLQGFELKGPLKPPASASKVVRLEAIQKVDNQSFPKKPNTPAPVAGRQTKRVVLSETMLAQDSKPAPSTQQLHAIEEPPTTPPKELPADALDMPEVELEEIVPIEEVQPAASTAIQGESSTTSTSAKKPITLDLLKPPTQKHNEEDEVEELPTLEFELLDESELDEMADFDEIYEELATPPKIPSTVKIAAQPSTLEQLSEPSIIEFDVDQYMGAINARDRNSAMNAARTAINHPPLVKALVKGFPGRLYVDRYQYIPRTMPPIHLHGPLLTAIITIGDTMSDHLTDFLDSTSLDLRFYATFLFTTIKATNNLALLYERIMDRDLQTRQVAFESLTYNQDHPDFKHIVLEPMHKLMAPTSDDLSVEIAAKLAANLRDKSSVPVLIDLLGQRQTRTQQTIQSALQAITLQHLPPSPIAWKNWWKKSSAEARESWILRAMNAPAEPIRELAEQELKATPNMSITYSAKMPAGSRVRAQQQIKQWYEQQGLL